MLQRVGQVRVQGPQQPPFAPSPLLCLVGTSTEGARGPPSFAGVTHSDLGAGLLKQDHLRAAEPLPSS